MSDYALDDPIYDTFIFETSKLLDEIETMIIESEKNDNFSIYNNKIRRNIHTIKGNSMTLEIDDISKLSHACEDLICLVDKDNLKNIEFTKIADIILEYIDYVRIKFNYLNDCESNKNKYLEILIKIKILKN